METTKDQGSGLLHQILPPRLEDSGLEDCALPPESIKEAFFRAAEAVKSRASSILATEYEHEGGCVDDPWPTVKEATDTVVGASPEKGTPGPCGNEKGSGLTELGVDDVRIGGGGVGGEDNGDNGDNVVVGNEEGKQMGLGGKPCVDELQGLNIEDPVENEGDDDIEEAEGERERPILVEGYI